MTPFRFRLTDGTTIAATFRPALDEYDWLPLWSTEALEVASLPEADTLLAHLYQFARHTRPGQGGAVRLRVVSR